MKLRVMFKCKLYGFIHTTFKNTSETSVPPLEVAGALSSFMNLKYTEGNFFHFLLKFFSRAWCGQIVLASAAVTIFGTSQNFFLLPTESIEQTVFEG